MSIATYSDLQTSISNWLHRADLSSLIPDFIALAEADLYGRLRISAMENTGSSSLSSDTLALPTGFRELRNIYLSGTPDVSLTYMAPQKMDEQYSEGSGRPLYYCIVGNQFRFAPYPDSTYTVYYTYYAAFDPLATTSTNWLLTNHPDVFLYGSLIHSAPYIQNDERTKLWNDMYEKALSRVIMEDKKKVWAGPMEMRSDVYYADVRY